MCDATHSTTFCIIGCNLSLFVDNSSIGKNISEIIAEACFVGATAVISREVETYGKSDHLVL